MFFYANRGLPPVNNAVNLIPTLLDGANWKKSFCLVKPQLNHL